MSAFGLNTANVKTQIQPQHLAEVLQIGLRLKFLLVAAEFPCLLVFHVSGEAGYFWQMFAFQMSTGQAWVWSRNV